jgi:hypothetical protein
LKNKEVKFLTNFLNIQVQFPMEIFVKKFQPEKYNDWINKKDIAPHPMDPPEVAKSK